MTTPLTSIVLVTVATIASGPGVSSDVATHVHDLGCRTRTVETHEMIVLSVGRDAVGVPVVGRVEVVRTQQMDTGDGGRPVLPEEENGRARRRPAD